ncbi:MAG: elongation factor 4 [Candidatus Omnitrophica bacterium]|nr:elongation factor 4 [Candidatus Omnitrophota bacterium]
MAENLLIRNFCIIAHIDHGKSTLADRILQMTGAISERESREQLLDDMDLERERGITIKASAVCLKYKSSSGKEYQLNLIDTPGHVDFSYEVSKALAACEGALLVVDAAQGVEAQTMANFFLALEQGLVMIPVVNKMDLPNAQPEKTASQLEDIFGFSRNEILFASAKEGTGIHEILERVITQIPSPRGNEKDPVQALVFDSSFDIYKGVMVYLRLFNGTLTPKKKIKFLGTGKIYEILELGVFTPHAKPVDQLTTGAVGFMACNIRDAKEVRIGDTVTLADQPAQVPLPGYKPAQPMVFCGIYPISNKDYTALRVALDKLSLNDASFVYEPENSASFGFGFRCGFLGLLHMEIIQERLEREYGLELILTTPSVIYRVLTSAGETVHIDNPTQLPPAQNIQEIAEPFITASLIVPVDAIGPMMELAISRRGMYKSTEYLGIERARLVFELPLSEILVDFYDKIKSTTKGYGSMNYEFKGYLPGDLVRLDILVNGERCDALSCIVPKEKAYFRGRAFVEKLKELIPRQLVEVILQAAVGNHVISRETISPLKKNVTGKCYGGDITRKRKLWEKQKEGKKRMKQFSKVEIPQEAFFAVLKIQE